MQSRIRDPQLADEGKLKTEWAMSEMKVLGNIRRKFSKEKPLKGKRFAACLHITSESAVLALTLKAGGAEVSLAASNPLSTQDDVAAYLVSQGIHVFGIRGDSKEDYIGNIRKALEIRPNFTIDDGGDLTVEVHRNPELLEDIYGGSEETTTGVIRLKNMADEGKLRYPLIAVNDSMTKQMFDNRYGTGQSAIDGILRATNTLIAGKTFVVIGFGWCGKGLAMRARGMGADVIVTEVDPVKALEAKMEGYRVMSIADAAKEGDIFVTVTGNKRVIGVEHIKSMKDGAIIANSGHFNIELDIAGLKRAATSKKRVRLDVEEFTLNGKRINLLTEGRLVNLGAAEGHPASVMDMSFSNHSLASVYLLENDVKPGVHVIPEEIDRGVARMKLETMGVAIDELTPDQEKYLKSWEEGT